ncbi:MAG: hypothetical protein IVW36_06735 [Dehalococcoidia bacterium]|nr:hypothetical protein [Dehalococcoidia bacterium]
MNGLPRHATDARMETVTSTFVAAGRPNGIHDLGRLLEQLNNPVLGDQIELHEATLRPLYRGGRPLDVDAPVVVRRDQLIFCNFEGPYFTRGIVQPVRTSAPVLLLAPPFQIRGTMSFALEADRTAALRTELHRFFVVRDALVFDAEGNELGEGDQIVVNGGAVQMISATALHIPALPARVAPATHRASPVADDETDADEASRAA